MLKAYMAHDGHPEEGAVLVFAHDAREAKKIAWPVLSGWDVEEYIHVRVNLLRDKSFLYDLKRSEDIPHVIDNPTTCKGCELWGDELDNRGYCEYCAEEMP